MDKVQFVDQTIRDAQQSLWGNMMRTEHIVPIAETMDKVGYFADSARWARRPSPSRCATTTRIPGKGSGWSRASCPTPALRGSYQTASLSSFDLSTPRDVISLWIKRSVANGVRSFWICDYQENMERFRYFAQVAKAEGAEVVTSLMYTSSPLHTDDHWMEKTRLIADAKDCIDRIMISDESGVITPERTRELVSLVQRHCDGIPLEFHCHCNSGLAPLCYLEAVQGRRDHAAHRGRAARQRHLSAGDGDASSRTCAAWATSATWTRTRWRPSRRTSGRSRNERGCRSAGRWSTTSSTSSTRCPAA